MSLTKKEIASTLTKELGLNPVVALDVVNSFFDNIKKTLANGEDVRLSGFGNFILNNKPERPGRNPKTGEEFVISARRVVTFKSGLKLKQFVNDEISSL